MHRPLIQRLLRIGLTIACGSLIAMMLVVVIDVASRHLFNTPLRGAYDLVSIFLLNMVFFGMASVLAQKSEILIDLVDAVLTDGGVRALRMIASALTVFACGFLLVAAIGPAMTAHRYNERSLELNLPIWTLWAITILGLAALLIVAIARGIDDLRRADRPDDAPGPDSRSME